MDQKSLHHTIAKAIRVEHDVDTDIMCLVFEITDEQFREEVRKDWTQDMELKLIGRHLAKNE